MPWLWAEQISDSEATLADFEVGHLSKALRGRVGSPVRVLDGCGNRANGVWLGEARVQVERRETLTQPRVTLIFGLGSRESNEESLRRAAELGAARIVPALCVRSRDAGAPKQLPLERWQKIMYSACGQSGNAWLPDLAELTPWDQVRQMYAADLGVVDFSGNSLLQKEKNLPLAIAVGPEGGFERREVEGLKAFSLGHLVLRTHVAVAVVMGQYALDL